MSTTPDGLIALLHLVKDFAPIIEKARMTPTDPADRIGAFAVQDGDLSDTALVGGKVIPQAGYRLTFLRRGSHPGARFELQLGGVVRSFAPGDVVEGYFGSFQLKRTAGCPSAGPYLLSIATNATVRYVESEADARASTKPVALVGTITDAGVPSYVTVAEDTDPSGGAPVGSFDPTGYSRLVVCIDGNSAGGNATTFDLVPWYDPSRVGTNWHEQGTERISVPDSDTTGQRFRVVSIPVAGNGLMYLAVRNLQAAARTGLGFCVLGVP